MTEFENFYHDKYGWCYYDLTPSRTPIVYGLFVELAFRRQGHAKRLLQEVIKIIRNTGYAGEIEIEAKGDTEELTEALKRLYGSLGFKII